MSSMFDGRGAGEALLYEARLWFSNTKRKRGCTWQEEFSGASGSCVRARWFRVGLLAEHGIGLFSPLQNRHRIVRTRLTRFAPVP